ncbi:MAG: Lipoprotein signal peptidase, partial [Pseudonocardiales bacterium]|nr:Lipoprotein signal peptidase [Pseudonocardiales bacterium]
LLGATVIIFVVVADQVSKWWGWSHANRASVDTGGGIFNEFTGGLANAVMRDPITGAVADVALAASLGWLGFRLLHRRRGWSVVLAASALLGGCTSNLLDRFGLHRVTAPGSARGVINWVSLGGRASSPLNIADLVCLAGATGLGVIAIRQILRAQVRSDQRRVAIGAALVAVAAISFAGAFNASNGLRSPSVHTVASAAPVVPAVGGSARSSSLTVVPTRDLGAPRAASADPNQNAIRTIVVTGVKVSVVWDDETVSVTGQKVLGWRTDGMSTLYLRAVVVGHQTLELYLPYAQTRSECTWNQPAIDASTGGISTWECNPGTPPLTLAKAPVPFP